jgi:hypothetical protein
MGGSFAGEIPDLKSLDPTGSLAESWPHDFFGVFSARFEGEFERISIMITIYFSIPEAFF